MTPRAREATDYNDPPRMAPVREQRLRRRERGPRCGARLEGRHRCRAVMPEGAMVCNRCAKLIAESQAGGMRFGTPADLVAIEEKQAEHRRLTAERNRADQRRARLAEGEHEPVVYYVATAPGTIKIGTTRNLPRRLREYRVALVKESLLAVEPGGRELEQQRHAQFERWRVTKRREDFARARELREHIAAVRAEHGDPTRLLRKASA